METADKDFLAETGNIVSQEVYHRKVVQINTRLHYAQRKYNLLREESEGYAKLIAALLRFEGGGLTDDRAGAVVRALSPLPPHGLAPLRQSAS